MDIPTNTEIKRTTNTETYLHLHKFTNYSIQTLAYTKAGDGVMSQPLFCTTEEDSKSDMDCEGLKIEEYFF